MRTNNNDISTFEKLQMALRFNTECNKVKYSSYPCGIKIEAGLFMLLLRAD